MGQPRMQGITVIHLRGNKSMDNSLQVLLRLKAASV